MAVWKEIDGFDGRYLVSDRGDVRDCLRGVLLRQGTSHDGCPSVVLHDGERRVVRRVHRLVAQAFVPNGGGLPHVGHRDGDRSNNAAENLVWTDAASGRGARRAAESNRERNGKRVRLTIDGREVAVFRSIGECAEHLGTSPCAVSAWARGLRRCAKGHVVEFV